MSTKRKYVDYLRDILDFAAMAERFVSGVDYAAFCADDEKTLAVIRTLEVIGEAARHLPASLRQRHPEIPWREIAGARDVLIHGYFGVDLEVVWKTVREDLPPLRQAVALMLAELEAHG